MVLFLCSHDYNGLKIIIVNACWKVYFENSLRRMLCSPIKMIKRCTRDASSIYSLMDTYLLMFGWPLAGSYRFLWRSHWILDGNQKFQAEISLNEIWRLDSNYSISGKPPKYYKYFLSWYVSILTFQHKATITWTPVRTELNIVYT